MIRPRERKQRLVQLYQSVAQIKFCPWTPTPKQRAFLLLDGRKALYGGAARGGKSIAALMGALQYICIPGYNALIVRKQISDLQLPGGLISVANDWFAQYAKWNGTTHTWTFETSGKKTAAISFGYLNAKGDEQRYKGAEIQYYALEEATEIADRDMAVYPNSRLTLPKAVLDAREPLEACSCHGWTLADIPLRWRLTSNPGGSGSEWVYQDFVKPARNGEKGIFLPATVYDNPYVDAEAYEESLAELSPAERERLLRGNWEITEAGKAFSRHDFKLVTLDEIPWGELTLVRRWDLASLKDAKGRNPDWTAGALVGLHRQTGDWFIVDIRRIRDVPEEAERFMYRVHLWDDNLAEGLVPIRAEEGKSGDGKWATKGLADGKFVGLDFLGVTPKGSKTERAIPVSTASRRGKVHVVEADWNEEFFIEADLFPDGNHDDMIDAISGAFYDLTSGSVEGGGYEGSGGIPEDSEIGHAYADDMMVGMVGPS